MHGAQILFSALLAVTVGYTIFGWPRRYGAISGRSRLYRTVGLAILDLLLALLAMVWSIDFTGGTGDVRTGELRWTLYIASCVLLVVFLLCIAVLDALETVSALRREERAYVQRVLHEEIARAREREKPDAGAPAPNETPNAS